MNILRYLYRLYLVYLICMSNNGIRVFYCAPQFPNLKNKGGTLGDGNGEGKKKEQMKSERQREEKEKKIK